MKYNEVQSEYIKKKIQKTSWIEHEKIDELICLYNYIRQPPIQYNSGWHFSFLKNRYEEEYLELLREFSVEAYKLAIIDMQNNKNRLIKQDAKAKQEETELRHEWLKAGGKP